MAQDSDPRVPVLGMIAEKLHESRLEGYRYAEMPADADAWKLVARGLDEAALEHGCASFAAAPHDTRRQVCQSFSAGEQYRVGEAQARGDLEAAGAGELLTIDRYAHLVGGCRMGASPDSSVVDSEHRAWELPNLFVADGSTMPTQGSANPALTVMALASRLAERLGRKRVPTPV